MFLKVEHLGGLRESSTEDMMEGQRRRNRYSPKLI